MMKLPALLLALVLVAVAAFAALNWGAMTTPTTLSLGVASVQGALGLVLLGMLVIVAALLLAIIVYLQGSALMETRRYSKELLAHRTLADQAEASRFTELRGYLQEALAGQAAGQSDAMAQMLGRLDRLEQAMRMHVEQSANGLAASIGELEDRLDAQRLPAGLHRPLDARP